MNKIIAAILLALTSTTTFAAIPLVLLLRPAKPPAKGEPQLAIAD